MSAHLALGVARSRWRTGSRARRTATDGGNWPANRRAFTRLVGGNTMVTINWEVHRLCVDSQTVAAATRSSRAWPTDLNNATSRRLLRPGARPCMRANRSPTGGRRAAGGPRRRPGPAFRLSAGVPRTPPSWCAAPGGPPFRSPTGRPESARRSRRNTTAPSPATKADANPATSTAAHLKPGLSNRRATHPSRAPAHPRQVGMRRYLLLERLGLDDH